jgi:hypothetical protein
MATRSRLSRGGRNRTLALDSMPELLGLVEAMRGTLSGDGATLQRYFKSTVTGAPGKWTLDLTPIDSRLAAQVRSIRISGRASDVLGLEMEFVGGDRSVMNISPNAPAAVRPPTRPRPARPDAPHVTTVNAAQQAGGPPGWRQRAIVLLAWLLVLLCGAVVIARTQIGADLSAFLPKSPDVRQRVLIEQLQSGVASRTLMLGIEGGSNAEQRAAVSRAVAKVMRESQLFDLIQNGDVGDWSEAGTWVLQHRYQLSPGVRLRSSPPRACATRSTKRCRCSARRPAT